MKNKTLYEHYYTIEENEFYYYIQVYLDYYTNDVVIFKGSRWTSDYDIEERVKF